MSTRTLKFSLSSYWRIGSGKGAGATADELVLRDGSGLPIIPGRTVKGLLREAMNLATLSGAVAPERVRRWFGSPLAGHAEGEPRPTDGDEQETLLEQGRFQSQEGALWFGTASLPETWRRWALTEDSDTKRDVVSALFTYLSSTAIDAKGVAQDHTLRVTEAAVPMELRAEVRGPEGDDAWVKDLKTCLPLLRALGSRRNRGLGRVDVTMEDA